MTTEPPSPRVEISTILGRFEAPFRREIVKELCRNLRAVEPGLRHRLENTMKAAAVRVDGFRNPSDAPPDRLAGVMAPRLTVDSQLAEAVATSWCDLRSDLATDVLECLKGRGDQLPLSFESDDDIEATFALAEEIAHEFPDSTTDELKLILCFMSRTPAVSNSPPDSGSESPALGSAQPSFEDLAGTPWQEWLAEISALPPGSPHWARVEAFMSAVHEAAKGKAALREGDRERVGQRAHEISVKFKAELTYLGLQDFISQVPQVSHALDGGKARDALQKLEIQLTLAREARERPVQTLQDDERRQADLKSARTEGGRVLEAFSASFPEPEEPSPPEPSGRPPDQPATVIEEAESQPHGQAIVESDAKEKQTPSREASRLAAEPQPEAESPVSHDGELAEPATDAKSKAPPDEPGEPPSHVEPRAMSSDVLAQQARELRGTGQHGEMTAVVSEIQIRWLLAGQNLRAYWAASTIEESQPPGVAPIPAWLCWLAVLTGDSKGVEADYSTTDLLAESYEVIEMAENPQRFFVAWLCVGLLGTAAARSLELASTIPDSLLEAGWSSGSRFDRFCLHHLLEPARRGNAPRVSPLESLDGLQKRLGSEVNAAAAIADRSVNYRNGFVRHYWLDLVSHGGPVERMIADAEQGKFMTTWPTEDELAGTIDGWTRVCARYRTNICSRLRDFLRHMKSAAALSAELTARTGGGQDALDADELQAVLPEAHSLTARLEAERSPSLVGYERVLARLSTIAETEVQQ